MITLDRNKAASLAGLAPVSRQSGKWRGKEHIQGGRTFVRRTVYVPALVAVQRKAQLKAKYCGLIEAEKPPKLALTAIMRRLVIRTLKEQCVHRHRFESIQHASRAVYDIEELREAVARLKGGDPVAEAAVAEAEEAAGRLQRKAG